MIQAILSSFFVFVFRREAKVAGKNPWTWALMGGLCYFGSSWLITQVLVLLVAAFRASLGSSYEVFVLGSIGVGLGLGWLLTEKVLAIKKKEWR